LCAGKKWTSNIKCDDTKYDTNDLYWLEWLILFLGQTIASNVFNNTRQQSTKQAK